ncbi:ThiF family adenylyltransferase [Phocaeicola sp. HCN-40430]|uniref:HesA/MoeB/ThiF family protein n=1 Tax=Phocaeicola sp. HCN-40430 TaxID=3134664 RepID=UPI0030BB5911
MFDYKDALFFTSYFQNHPDFNLVEVFKESDDEDEKNIYVGLVEVKNTIHPLIIRVEIPFTFPHSKLTFRTKSLSGYPHLIHNGKIKYGDWFCLNTPFAESVVEQLNQEISRLKEWITRQMRADLPAVIEDPSVRSALALANAYEWENPDEVKEFRSNATFTFVGDFEKNADNFPDKLGYLHCIKTPDNRFYAFNGKQSFTNYKLPYIIVDEFPKSFDVLDDFLKLKENYAWNNEICMHILKDFETSGAWKIIDNSRWHGISLSKDEALRKINEIREELDKEVSYIGSACDNKSKTRVFPIHKNLILSYLDKIEPSIHNNNGVKIEPMKVGDCYDDEEENINESYRFKHFAFGFKDGNEIKWLVFYTNYIAVKAESIDYNLGVRHISVSRDVRIPLRYMSVQSIDSYMFFGRGCLCNNLREKRIAIVGLGAIGSMVAESLVHSGINKIGLWDSDIIEPGNICRSTYSLADLGESKVQAIAKKIRSINPFIEAKEIKAHGYWFMHNVNYNEYVEGSFYDNVNYKSQEESLKEIQDFDMIIDCTGSNEMLHFLSYAVPEKELISLCITNHANELVCTTNADGNAFELRKAYLSRIEQDTKNFYVEGSGCYSPTFLAKYFDIASLVNCCIRRLDSTINDGKIMHSYVLSHCNNGILIDYIHTYKLKDYNIYLNIPEETILDTKEMTKTDGSYLGYVLGCYSADGKQIMITHIVEYSSAKEKLNDAYSTSKGIIDYIGDYAYSDYENDSYSSDLFDSIAAKSADDEINTNNPLLIIKKKDGSLSFLLFINNELVPFEEMN